MNCPDCGTELKEIIHWIEDDDGEMSVEGQVCPNGCEVDE